MNSTLSKKTKRASKYLSLLLRHEPEKIGLKLDSAGWARTEDLVQLSAHGSVKFTSELLRKITENCDKQRFSISKDGTLIRANQGHSIRVELGLTPQTPPVVLYHGTASRFLQSIQKEGLIKQSRQHVHLSEKLNTAHDVGTRHGVPVTLYIDTQAMLNDDHKFYLSENNVWLTDRVPAKYLYTDKGFCKRLK